MESSRKVHCLQGVTRRRRRSLHIWFNKDDRHLTGLFPQETVPATVMVIANCCWKLHFTIRPWITMECSQPVAWTTNRSLLVASRVRPFQEDRPIPVRPYPELRTWMVVRSGVICVFPTHSGNSPASPDIQPTTWLCPACLPSTNSIPAPIQPTIAMTTTHIHQL